MKGEGFGPSLELQSTMDRKHTSNLNSQSAHLKTVTVENMLVLNMLSMLKQLQGSAIQQCGNNYSAGVACLSDRQQGGEQSSFHLPSISVRVNNAQSLP